MHTHSLRPDVIKRLKRAHGHLAKVIEMMEGDTECLMIAQQLQAVVNAVNNAKTLHVQDHIEHCLEVALTEAKLNRKSPAIGEFKEIAKYL
jgi:DNA-binding FrmR family transcriptional regulator